MDIGYVIFYVELFFIFVYVVVVIFYFIRFLLKMFFWGGDFLKDLIFYI